jgi:hypothetical protein
MSPPSPPLVLADGVSADQLRQLAAVMLGLVVFAAVFILVERQRARRGGDQVSPPPLEDRPAPPPVEYPPWTPPPPHTGAAPALAEGELKDELPVPFVPRDHGPAGAAADPAAPSSVGALTAGAPPTAPPAPARPGLETPEEPAEPAAVETAESGSAPLDKPPEGSHPESPAEIGIIIPDEPAEPAKPAET